MDHDDVVSRVHSEGTDNLIEAIGRGKGVICALPHMGNWDVAALWLVAQGYPFTTVAERLKPESLFDRFVAYRESLGMEVVALTGGERPPTDILKERLEAGRVICLVADRDLSRNGIDVTFFGEATRMPAGPALLAATTGAAVCPVGCGSPRTAGVTGSTRRSRCRPRGGCATGSRRPPRRSRTRSSARSPRIRSTGTCSSDCGWPTSAAPAGRRPGGEPAESGGGDR